MVRFRRYGRGRAFAWARLSLDGGASLAVTPLCPKHLRETGAPSVKGDGAYLCGLCHPGKAIVVAA